MNMHANKSFLLAKFKFRRFLLFARFDRTACHENLDCPPSEFLSELELQFSLELVNIGCGAALLKRKVAGCVTGVISG